MRIARRVACELPIELEVVPGISALQALAATHAVPLNRLASPVLITTGRRLRQQGCPPDDACGLGRHARWRHGV